MLTIDELWQSPDHSVWTAALDRYWCFVQPANLALEKSLDRLDLERIRSLDAQGWYDFLFAEYFKWKYTVANRYKTTTESLSVYATEPGGLDKLHAVRVHGPKVDVHYAKTSDFRGIRRGECQNRSPKLSHNSVTSRCHCKIDW